MEHIQIKTAAQDQEFELKTDCDCSYKNVPMNRTLFALLFCANTLAAQVANYQSEFNTINKNLMLGLGSYAVSNFVLSGIGYATAEDESIKRFHEMNVMWNTVNIGLAVPGYLKAVRGGDEMTFEEMLKVQRKTETVFLINGVLDVGYITAGLWMCQNSVNFPDQEALYMGYGNSLILQGGFLLLFDAYAYRVHHNHAKQLPVLNKVSFSPTMNGLGLRVALN